MKQLFKKIGMLIAILACALVFSSCENSSGVSDVRDVADNPHIGITVASSDPTTVTYSNSYVKSSTGNVYITNNSDKSVEVVLMAQIMDDNDLEDETDDHMLVSIEPGDKAFAGMAIIGIPYSIGCRANAAEEGDNVELIFSDEASDHSNGNEDDDAGTSGEGIVQ